MIYDTKGKTYWEFVRLEPRLERLLELSRNSTPGKPVWVKIKDVKCIGPEEELPTDTWKEFCKKRGIPRCDQKDAAWLVMIAGPQLFPDLYQCGLKAAWPPEYQCVNFLWVLESYKKHCVTLLQTYSRRSRVARRSSDWCGCVEIALEFVKALHTDEEIPAFSGFCWHCQKLPDECHKFRKCQSCKTACYCSRLCQQKDWPAHKQWCQSLSPSLPAV